MQKRVRIALRAAALIFIAIGVFVLIFNRALQTPLIFASFASSIFTIFTFPKHHTADTKVVLGAQFIAAITGYGVSFLFPEFSALGAALAVGITSLLMISFNMRHPPAAGTALSFMYNAGVLSSTTNLFIAFGMIAALGLIKIAWKLGRTAFRELAEELESLESKLR